MQDVFKVVTSAREQGISVLLVEQNVRAAVEIADRAYVLDDGTWSIPARQPNSPRTRSACAHSPARAPRMGTARLVRLSLLFANKYCSAQREFRRRRRESHALSLPFVFMVFITMTLVYVFPGIALWLPSKLYAN